MLEWNDCLQNILFLIIILHLLFDLFRNVFLLKYLGWDKMIPIVTAFKELIFGNINLYVLAELVLLAAYCFHV